MKVQEKELEKETLSTWGERAEGGRGIDRREREEGGGREARDI